MGYRAWQRLHQLHQCASLARTHTYTWLHAPSMPCLGAGRHGSLPVSLPAVCSSGGVGSVWQLAFKGLERACGGSWRPLAPIFAAMVWEWWCGSPGCDRVCVQSDATGWGGGRSGSPWGDAHKPAWLTQVLSPPMQLHPVCRLCCGLALQEALWFRQVPRTACMYVCMHKGWSRGLMAAGAPTSYALCARQYAVSNGSLLPRSSIAAGVSWQPPDMCWLGAGW